MIKSIMIGWSGNVACMGRKTTYRISVGKPHGTKPLGRPRCGRDDNNKLNLIPKGWGGMDSIYLPRDRDQWGALLNTVMNLRVP
jgi:hypothetical protein